jgi:hypothetical protein
MTDAGLQRDCAPLNHLQMELLRRWCALGLSFQKKPFSTLSVTNCDRPIGGELEGLTERMRKLLRDQRVIGGEGVRLYGELAI